MYVGVIFIWYLGDCLFFGCNLFGCCGDEFDFPFFFSIGDFFLMFVKCDWV